MKTYSFEKLHVWKEACQLARMIYQITYNKFPKNEKFGLSSQIQRASVSVSSNIAEGTSRFSTKEQSRFTNIAFSSLMEVLSQLHISYDMQYIDKDDYTKLRELIDSISVKLCKLRQSQLKK